MVQSLSSSTARCRFHALVLTLLVACLTLNAAEPPNVILLMGDDHGWEETGYIGHPHVQTPVLDDMAAQGLRLDRFYAAHPSCSPTRGSVLTGRHPNRYGTFSPNWSIRPEEITIAHRLREAGYRCGHFGKWHLGPVKADSPTSPGAMGFHEWLSHDNFFELNPTFSRNGADPERFIGESSEIVIEETLRFIKAAQSRQQPFFAVVWFGSPHEPYSGLETDLARYDQLPDEYQHRNVALTSNDTGSRVVRPLRDVLRERYAEITAMDRAMGHLRESLQEAGLRDNTLLWYCGDNGTPASGVLASPLRGLKGTMYEGGIRVPGIIEWPAQIPKGRTSQIPTVTSDMLPTLCALAGIEPPDRPLDGINLVDLLEGEMKHRPSPIHFWSYETKHEIQRHHEPYIEPSLQEGTTPLVKLMNGKPTRTFRNLKHDEVTAEDYMGTRVIIDDRWKLIIADRAPNKSHSQLYDLLNDPAETTNRIQDKPAVQRRLRTALRHWQTSVLQSLTEHDYE